jgi:outer membrane protein OmpA-like peptidoglycan-associated protein
MRMRLAALLAMTALGGCSLFFGEQDYSIFFEPYSSKLDSQAMTTVRSASRYAMGHARARVLVTGYSAPADPALKVDGLSAQRADAVKQALVSDGVDPDRITTEANGVTDPKTLPSLAVRRVDISFAGL